MKSVVKMAVVALVALQCTTDAAEASQNLRAAEANQNLQETFIGGGFLSSLIQSCLNGYGLFGNNGGGGKGMWGGGAASGDANMGGQGGGWS